MKLKKKKVIAAGILAGSASLLAGCGNTASLQDSPQATPPVTPPASFEPENNFPVTVYGPPEMFESQFIPEENIPEDVYGPPIFFESEDLEQSSSTTEENQ